MQIDPNLKNTALQKYVHDHVAKGMRKTLIEIKYCHFVAKTDLNLETLLKYVEFVSKSSTLKRSVQFHLDLEDWSFRLDRGSRASPHVGKKSLSAIEIIKRGGLLHIMDKEGKIRISKGKKKLYLLPRYRNMSVTTKSEAENQSEKLHEDESDSSIGDSNLQLFS